MIVNGSVCAHGDLNQSLRGRRVQVWISVGRSWIVTLKLKASSDFSNYRFDPASTKGRLIGFYRENNGKKWIFKTVKDHKNSTFNKSIC